METGSAPHTLCEDNAQTEIQVVRTLWDIYDSQVDGSDVGTIGSSRFAILETWDRFADGIGNNEDQEGGPDGVNVWDFRENAGWNSDLQLDVNLAMSTNDTNCQSSN